MAFNVLQANDITLLKAWAKRRRERNSRRVTSNQIAQTQWFKRQSDKSDHKIQAEHCYKPL